MTLDPARVRSLGGFGGVDAADAYVFRPASVVEIRSLLELARAVRRPVVLRGAGRSYGDAATLAEAVALDLTRMDRVLAWDPQTGRIECEPGVTLERVWRHTLEDGWWSPVVSGTMAPTLGGALAMNIHGKNHPRAGTLGEHTREIDLLLADGSLRTLTPADDLFHAVVGGCGLFGVIVRAVLQLERITSGNVRVLTTSPRNWDAMFAEFDQHEDADHRVAWIDLFARGSSAGRGQFSAAWHLRPERPDFLSLRPSEQDPADTVFGFLPKSVLWRALRPFLNRTGMRLLNGAKDRAGRLLGDGKTVTLGLVSFNFQLDYVPEWRRAYGEHGFVQHQSFVPEGQVKWTFRRMAELGQEARLESTFGVMKRHRPDPFLLGYGVDGYSLALDFKVTPQNRARLLDLCHRMNDLVLEAGGRFYLAKDSTLRPSDARAYLGEPAWTRLHALKAELDPEGLFSTALSRRLFGF